MAKLGNVIKISKSDYNTLVGGGTITKGGVTYSYDPNAIYLIAPEAVGSATQPVYVNNNGDLTAGNTMVDLTSAQTITGEKTFSGFGKFKAANIKLLDFYGQDYCGEIGVDDGCFSFADTLSLVTPARNNVISLDTYNGAIKSKKNGASSYATYTLPSQSGTLALTSDIDNCVKTDNVTQYIQGLKNFGGANSSSYPRIQLSSTGLYCYSNSNNYLAIRNYTSAGVLNTAFDFRNASMSSNCIFLLPAKTGTNTLATTGDFSASASEVSGATEAKSLTINGTSWNLPSGGGGSGITEISDQYVRIWGLAAGVYKLTYNGTKYLYYSGSSGTSKHTVEGSSGAVILTVSDYSTTYKHWWYINGSTGYASICHGYTSSSSGRLGYPKEINKLVTAAGTKLYLHAISGFQNTAVQENSTTLYVINTHSGAYTSSSFQFTNPFTTVIPSESSLSVKASLAGSSTVTILDGYVSSSNMAIKYFRQNTSTTIYSGTYSYSNITDSVTAI